MGSAPGLLKGRWTVPRPDRGSKKICRQMPHALA
jgi:hypothetical protein